MLPALIGSLKSEICLNSVQEYNFHLTENIRFPHYKEKFVISVLGNQ